MDYKSIHTSYKLDSLQGRYVHLDHIQPILDAMSDQLSVTVVGTSVEDRPIYQCRIGHGKFKILAWSQMHGNESTTTKAVFDLLQFLVSDDERAIQFRSFFTLTVLPVLNPDGALYYTRANANGVDLNRDFVQLSQPESQCLMHIYDTWKPDLCLNLHDQRTIFGVGSPVKPATVSFLAPSFDEERSINTNRQLAINIIAGLHKTLECFIPEQIGRFDDAYNRNCVGDAFQSLGTPTILFEAGHFPEDYQREHTRFYVFISLLEVLKLVYENDIVDNKTTYYLNIPQNKTVFYDIVYKNVKINYETSENYTNFAVQYKERIEAGAVVFDAIIVDVGDLTGKQGLLEYDLQGVKAISENENFPDAGQIATFTLENNVNFVNGLINN